MSATAGSGRMLWRTWLVWVTAGETLGFCVPALVAALTAGRPATVALPSLLLAGAVEGALLGGAQVHVLRRMLPGLSWRRWVAATSGAVVLAWLVGLLPATLWDVAAGWPIPVLVSLALGAGVVLLLPIGTAQWLVLRHHAAGVAWWVPVTALAWLAGLAVFVLVAPPLWRDGQPPVLVAAFGVLGGVMMAFTVAAVTGIGVVRLARRSRPETPRIRSVAPGFSDVNWLAQAGRGRQRAGHQCHGPRRRVERTHDPGVFCSMTTRWCGGGWPSCWPPTAISRWWASLGRRRKRPGPWMWLPARMSSQAMLQKRALHGGGSPDVRSTSDGLDRQAGSLNRSGHTRRITSTAAAQARVMATPAVVRST